MDFTNDPPIQTRPRSNSFGSQVTTIAVKNGWANTTVLKVVGEIQYGEKSDFIKLQEGGIVTQWNKRWVVVESNFLKIFSDQMDVDANKIIDLTEMIIEPFPQKHKYCIHIGNKKAHYYLRLDGLEKVDDWMHHLIKFATNREKFLAQKDFLNFKAEQNQILKEQAIDTTSNIPPIQSQSQTPSSSNDTKKRNNSLVQPPQSKVAPKPQSKPDAISNLKGSLINVEVLSAEINDAKKKQIIYVI